MTYDDKVGCTDKNSDCKRVDFQVFSQGNNPLR